MSESEYSGSESDSDCSIYNEIEELIATTVQQQVAYEESIAVLERVQGLIGYNSTIDIIYNNEIVDLNDIIDKFHLESLKSIDTSGNIIFGQLLVECVKSQIPLNKID